MCINAYLYANAAKLVVIRCCNVVLIVFVYVCLSVSCCCCCCCCLSFSVSLLTLFFSLFSPFPPNLYLSLSFFSLSKSLSGLIPPPTLPQLPPLVVPQTTLLPSPLLPLPPPLPPPPLSTPPAYLLTATPPTISTAAPCASACPSLPALCPPPSTTSRQGKGQSPRPTTLPPPASTSRNHTATSRVLSVLQPATAATEFTAAQKKKQNTMTVNLLAFSTDVGFFKVKYNE